MRHRHQGGKGRPGVTRLPCAPTARALRAGSRRLEVQASTRWDHAMPPARPLIGSSADKRNMMLMRIISRSPYLIIAVSLILRSFACRASSDPLRVPLVHGRTRRPREEAIPDPREITAVEQQTLGYPPRPAPSHDEGRSKVEPRLIKIEAMCPSCASSAGTRRHQGLCPPGD